ncbi:hypothetical protein BDI4_130013 [Burkholderia diffusa]|nr:hypothetical protein BDI4_130013 [Burkholderia diffusa]
MAIQPLGVGVRRSSRESSERSREGFMSTVPWGDRGAVSCAPRRSRRTRRWTRKNVVHRNRLLRMSESSVTGMVRRAYQGNSRRKRYTDGWKGASARRVTRKGHRAVCAATAPNMQCASRAKNAAKRQSRAVASPSGETRYALSRTGRPAALADWQPARRGQPAPVGCRPRRPLRPLRRRAGAARESA